jgi:hypothetical protein
MADHTVSRWDAEKVRLLREAKTLDWFRIRDHLPGCPNCGATIWLIGWSEEADQFFLISWCGIPAEADIDFQPALDDLAAVGIYPDDSTVS